jgi:hypothetical protein
MISEPPITVSGGLILSERHNQRYKNNHFKILLKWSTKTSRSAYKVHQPTLDKTSETVRYAIQYRDKPISRLWELLWNAEVPRCTVWYMCGSLTLSRIHSTCWDNLTQGVPSFSFTVQLPQRPVSIFWHWCTRAACSRLSIRKQWPSVSLNNGLVFLPQYLFGWSASSDINKVSTISCQWNLLLNSWIQSTHSHLTSPRHTG